MHKVILLANMIVLAGASASGKTEVAKLLAKNGLTKEFCEKKRYKMHRQIIEFQLFKFFRGVSFRFKSLIIA